MYIVSCFLLCSSLLITVFVLLFVLFFFSISLWIRLMETNLAAVELSERRKVESKCVLTQSTPFYLSIFLLWRTLKEVRKYVFYAIVKMRLYSTMITLHKYPIIICRMIYVCVATTFLSLCDTEATQFEFVFYWSLLLVCIQDYCLTI